MESWTKTFTHKGKKYKATFLKRPFREGLEVRVVSGKRTFVVAELGLGERALIEKIKALLQQQES